MTRDDVRIAHVLHNPLVSALDQNGWWPGSIVIELSLAVVTLDGRHWQARRARTGPDGIPRYGYTRRQARQILQAARQLIIEDAAAEIARIAPELGFQRHTYG